MEDNNENKEQGQEIEKSNNVDGNPTMSVITFYVSGLSALILRGGQSV